MKVVDVPIGKLKPSEYNPRAMSSKEVADLTASIEKFGMVEPIVVNKHKGRENVIVGGHQRYFICKKLSWGSMPVVYVDLDEERERELNLRLNKNVGHWDWDMLANFDMKVLEDVGFDIKEIEAITHKFGEIEEMEIDMDNVKTKNICPKCKYEW